MMKNNVLKPSGDSDSVPETVKISIIVKGSVEQEVDYHENSNTESVEKKLSKAYGRGILKFGNIGVLSETLKAGLYTYLVTEQGKIYSNPSLLPHLFVACSFFCHLFLITLFFNQSILFFADLTFMHLH
jgi:hypothetical protein